MGEWDGYILEDFDYTFPPRSVVIDIGCGKGMQLATYIEEGHSATGVDLNPWGALQQVRSHIAAARAEVLPFNNNYADGILSKVMLPYTDDRKAIAEIARVLKPGGRCILVGHGFGYSLRYICNSRDWRLRFYGARTLLNSALFFATGRPLPGFLGDTIAQTKRRLTGLYQENGLVLTRETPSRKFVGFPVFLYHNLRKV